MKRRLVLALLSCALASPAAAVDNVDLLAACRSVMEGGGNAETCGCFVALAQQEMSPLQRDVLFMHLTGRDREAAEVLGTAHGPAYSAAMRRLTQRVSQQCGSN